MVKYTLLFSLKKNRKFLKIFYLMLKFLIIASDNSNKIVIIKTDGSRVYKRKLKNLNVKFYGKNNVIEIQEPYKIKQLNCICYGSNNKLVLKKQASIKKYMRVIFQEANFLEIDEKFSLQSSLFSFRNSKSKKIKIGKDCMFSYNLEIRVSDAHLIYDINTKEIVNMPRDIVIGNHIWIAAGTKVLKGAKIPDNCIVGANSIVTKAFEEKNCIIAGSPAKVVKTGVNWHKCATYEWDSYKDFV